jgi:ADP-ribosylglycohydrolase
MIGGGPFHLRPGEWTDDTSMALCLAESLLECNGFDARDQMQRYVRWWREGSHSSTGHCVDIGNTVRQALTAFERTGDPRSGPTHEMSAGNGSLMRLAPVAMFFSKYSDVDAIAMCGESSVNTHGAPVAVDACRYLGALIAGALSFASKEELLAPRYAEQRGYWDAKPLHPAIAEIADGSFKRKKPPEIRGSGYAAHSLEAALWAFYKSSNFRKGCLMAVNLGEDADTTGAIYGQLAGAYYGAMGIPEKWLARLAKRELLQDYAYRLSYDAWRHRRGTS